MKTTTRPRKFLASIIGAVIVSSTIIATPASSNEIDVRQSAREAAVVLEELPVKGRAPKTGYSRSAFGSAWRDVDRNGCDTRNDVLARDLDERTKSGSCTVTSGVLYPDPYTGMKILYIRGKSKIDIDHVVALGNAWVTGAQQLTTEKRTALANDPLNLLAVDYSANRQKSDADAATWLPSNKSFRCEYVARQVAVKSVYGLWVTPPERDAIARVLVTCPGQKLPDSGKPTPGATTPPGAPVTPPAAVNTPTQSGVNQSDQAVRFKNCTAARAAGVTPIVKANSPALYAANPHLDRDKDGVACQ